MDLFRFLVERSRSSQRAIAWLIVISGLSSGLLLGVVNATAERAVEGGMQLHLVLLFALVLALNTVTKRAALKRASVAAEQAIRDIRVKLSDRVRRSELQFIESIGRSEIYARLTQDTSSVSQAMPIVFNGYQSAVVIFAGLAYMATISVEAFILTALGLGIGAWAFLNAHKRSLAEILQALAKETEFFDSLGHLLDGIKEIKLSRRKNEGVFRRISVVAEETRHLIVGTVLRYVNHVVVLQLLIFCVIALLIFVLPSFEYLDGQQVLKLTATMLFLIGPIEITLYAWHAQTKAKAALSGIVRLEAQLAAAGDNSTSAAVSDEKTDLWRNFRRIDLSQVTFSYPDPAHPFQVGPVDLSIVRGETTFIVGGNGCGKSTLLKLLTGLYHPVGGHIVIDGQAIGPDDYQGYRELFSAIFADFHLFDELYDLDAVDAERVNELLRRMGLADKTEYRDGRFTTLDLSTGQRKRLALVAAILEDRPIYIFDEWAADQDPEFRVQFYDAILPELRARGKTVIAVTHDDRYFARCDQLAKMDYGQIARIERPSGG